MKDYYKILELAQTATLEQIKVQHKLLLHAWHPDKFPEGDLKKKAHEKTLEINEAYSVLGNAAKRYSYDQKYKENFQSTSSNNTYQNPRERTDTDSRYKTNTGSSNSSKENISTQPENKTKRKLQALIVVLFILIILIYFYNMFSSETIGRENPQQIANTSTIKLVPTKVITPSITLDAFSILRKRCLYWADINISLVGETICVFGKIVTFTPKQEIRVPAIGSEWIWYYYFSFENEDFAIMHPSNEVNKLKDSQKFPDAYIGCIEVTGELKTNKTKFLYIEIWSGNSQNWKLLSDC